MESNTTQPSKSRLPWIILTILILLLAGFFSFLVFTAMRQDARDPAMQPPKTEAAKTESISASSAEVSTHPSVFLSKLQKEKDVSLLFLGDSYSAGAAQGQNTLWQDALLNLLHDRFHARLHSDNLALPAGNDTYSSYVAYMRQVSAQTSPYDAIFLSLGFYDDPFTFETYLRGLIACLQAHNPDAVIYGLIPSSALTASVGNADENATLQTAILQSTGCQTINLSEAFAVSHQDFSTLTDDGILPNEAGADVISKWILLSIEKDPTLPETSFDADASDSSKAFLDFAYLDAAKFNRMDDTHYQLTGTPKSYGFSHSTALVGIEFNTVEATSFEVSIGDRLFRSADRTPALSDSGRYILPLGNNLILQDPLVLTFSSKESADQFHGLILSGNVSLIGKPILPEMPETTVAIPESTESSESAESTIAETSSEPASHDALTEESKKQTVIQQSSPVKRSHESATSESTASRKAVEKPETLPAPQESASPESSPVIPSVSAPESHPSSMTPKTIRPGQGIDPEAWSKNAPSVPIS